MNLCVCVCVCVCTHFKIYKNFSKTFKIHTDVPLGPFVLLLMKQPKLIKNSKWLDKILRVWSKSYK
jgi:hypothetical protein